MCGFESWRAGGGLACPRSMRCRGERRHHRTPSPRGKRGRRLDDDAGAAPAGSAPRTEHLAAFGLAGASSALASGKKQAALLRRIVALNRAFPRTSLGRSCATEPRLGGQICFSNDLLFAPIYSDLAGHAWNDASAAVGLCASPCLYSKRPGAGQARSLTRRRTRRERREGSEAIYDATRTRPITLTRPSRLPRRRPLPCREGLPQ